MPVATPTRISRRAQYVMEHYPPNADRRGIPILIAGIDSGGASIRRSPAVMGVFPGEFLNERRSIADYAKDITKPVYHSAKVEESRAGILMRFHRRV